MVNKLNSIIQEIDEHFINCVWNSRPPIKEIDFQLLVLAQKIINLRNELDEIKNIDYAISQIMTFMEDTFSIPMFNVKEWLAKSAIRHQLILDVYNQLSNLRSI